MSTRSGQTSYMELGTQNQQPTNQLQVSTQIAQNYPQFVVQVCAADQSPEQLRTLRSAFDAARRLFAALERPSAKPFLDHLVGTASVAMLGGASTNTVAAALVHAAYQQGVFPDRKRGPTSAHRRWLAG
jgi:(p)ppGpp synthase/HD superfamily hydrolase